MKLLSTEEYLFLIDEETVCKEGEIYLSSIKNDIKIKKRGVIQAGDKIIAYYPLQSSSKALDGIPLLPNPSRQEVSYVKLAEERYPYSKSRYQSEREVENDSADYLRDGFEEGYKTAQSLGTYTIEDIKKAYQTGEGRGKSSKTGVQPYLSEEEFIQSLASSKLPRDFVPEMEAYSPYDPRSKTGRHDSEDDVKPLFILNEEGKEVILGEYVY